MKFNSSTSIDDNYYESEDHYVEIDGYDKMIRFRKYRVRYSPVDDFNTEMDEAFSLGDLEQRKDLQDLAFRWFGERVLQELLAEARRICGSS